MLDAELFLDQPATVAARQRARAFLQRVLEKAVRVEAPMTPAAKREPVHDFRVAIRRLRAWMRAWRPQLLDAELRKTERRFRSISRVAGRARDLEVQRAVIVAKYSRGSPVVAAGARWIAERANAEYGVACRELAMVLLRDLGPAAARLHEELERPAPAGPVETARPETAASVMARQLSAHVVALPALLRRVRSAKHVTAAHEVRIAVRRFRYALDSISGFTPDVDLAAGYLVKLQDRLGDLHDSHVLEAQITALADGESSPAAAAVPMLELIALRTRVRLRIAREYRRVTRTIADPERRSSMAAVRRVIRSLGAISDPPQELDAAAAIHQLVPTVPK